MARTTRGRKPWQIREADAPQAGPAIRPLRAWWGRWSRWALAQLDALPDGDAPATLDAFRVVLLLRAQAASAPPPPLRAWEQRGRIDAPQAIRAELDYLGRLGMPPRILARIAGLPEPRTDARGQRVRTRVTTAQIVRAVPAISGVIEGDVATWVLAGVRLIRSVPTETIDQLAVIVRESVTNGETWRTLRDKLSAHVEAGASRLELIARDQSAKLNSRITEVMQSRAGVTEYTWRATMDARTRLVHRQANGTVIAWASAGYPGAGFYGRPAHAGRGGQCRCVAEPVIPDDWLD